MMSLYISCFWVLLIFIWPFVCPGQVFSLPQSKEKWWQWWWRASETWTWDLEPVGCWVGKAATITTIYFTNCPPVSPHSYLPHTNPDWYTGLYGLWMDWTLIMEYWFDLWWFDIILHFLFTCCFLVFNTLFKSIQLGLVSNVLSSM